MENKNLTANDIQTFKDLNGKIVDAIYKYVEHKYPNINDFWLEGWDILGDHIHFEFGSEEEYIDDAVDIDEVLKIYNE